MGTNSCHRRVFTKFKRGDILFRAVAPADLGIHTASHSARIWLTLRGDIGILVPNEDCDNRYVRKCMRMLPQA